MTNLHDSLDPFEQFFDANQFIKQVDELGIEYYTRASTGRSGMSFRGLARFVGVNHPAIAYWVKRISETDPVNNDLPECFKPFAGKNLRLVNNSDPQGSEILSDEFCAAVAAYYAAFAPAKNQTPEAKMALMVCSGMGLRSFIQSKTGWKKQSVAHSTPQLQPLSYVQQAIQAAKQIKEELGLDGKEALGFAEALIDKELGVTQSHPQKQTTTGRSVFQEERALSISCRRILEVMTHEPATAREIAVRAGISYSGARGELAELHERGLIRRRPVRASEIGRNGNTRLFLWWVD